MMGVLWQTTSALKCWDGTAYATNVRTRNSSDWADYAVEKECPVESNACFRTTRLKERPKSRFALIFLI